MNKRTIEDLPADLTGRRVLMRVDYNVPVSEGRVGDDRRIRGTLPTLRSLLDRGAALILMSHLGRPKGEWNEALSLRPVADRLGELIDAPVRFVDAVVGPEVKGAAESLQPGEILVLQNTRFMPGEKENDWALSEGMATLADIYASDAFGAAHRAHASTVGAAEAMREKGGPAVAGLLMEAELTFLGGALESPDRPFVSIIGGAKISGKIDVIESLLPRVDRLLIGGAMANTFFEAMGLETGDSLVEEERIEMAAELLERAGDVLMLPEDCVIAEEATDGAETRTVARDAVPAGWKILDIGPATVDAFGAVVKDAGTVIWNGPMGMFEVAPFRAGTDGLAGAVADATDAGATTIIGGGDTAAAVTEAGLEDRMTHVSTGGGASLEFLEGQTLPGVAALDDEED
ncbi:MAG: phosphoglycerate kinase [Candidatus Longimicrobiales bacterium M2_2A_002]